MHASRRHHAAAALLVTALTLVLFEVAVRWIAPQPQLYPRYRYSERYGHLLPRSTSIVHELPGSWRFVYTTNEYGFRVSMPAVSNRYDVPNVVVLGDSVTFGQGVNDGDEYPALLGAQLRGQAQVVNLGVPSFGLTHQIRLFYEFGVVYQPAAVVLQFTFNDPDDNFYERVTSVENGRFGFHPDRSMGSAMRQLKDWLSGSTLQRSAAYNFVRNTAYAYWYCRRQACADAAGSREEREDFYNALLRAFAQDLERRNIRLVLFDVPGNLAKWPAIRAEAQALERRGLLRLLDSAAWFEGAAHYGTPEGHPWGRKGHAIVARHLVPPLRAALGIPHNPRLQPAGP